jgi:phenylacetate-coenzyme A ligase PaaK-like adenylate-forming protein
MKSIEIIRKFMKSHFILEKIAREVIARFPLPLQYRLYYGKTFLYWSAFLKESEYWDKERLEAFQVVQLKALLTHAARYVPYYQKIFSDYGFNPGKMQCLNDIKPLPYLTKETVRDRIKDFVAENVSRGSLIKTTTSGSTGIPLVIYKTRESDEQYLAYLFNIMSRVGFNPKKRIVFLKWRDTTIGKRKFKFLRYGNTLIIYAAYITNEWMQKIL